MEEFFYIVGGAVVVAAVLAAIAKWLEPALRRLENVLTWTSTAIIFGAMAFICAEVVMRYGFNSPIPGHLEGSELLVPIIVFFAVSYTQARNGHVGMTLVTDALPAKVRRIVEMVTLLLSMGICSILSYFGAKYAYGLWDYDDVTMTPPYWHTWPSAAAISLGYGMMAVRMWLQFLHAWKPDTFPDGPADDSNLHTAE